MSKVKPKFNFFSSFYFRFGLSALLLWFIFTKIDIAQTKETLRNADFTFILYAFIIFIILNLIAIFRWIVFIRALNLNSSFLEVVRYFLVGLFGNLFLPSAIGGDVIKILGLCKNSNQKPRVVASVLLDRLSGFAGMVIIAIAAYFMGRNLINDNAIFIPVVLMAVVSVGIAAVLFNEKIYAFGCQIFKKFPKIQKALMSLHYDIMLMKDKKMEGVKAVFLSCVLQILLAVIFYLVARSLNQEIGMIYFLIFVPLICVAAAFPSIGGLGVREAGAAYLFSKIGVESGIAVSISLINFLFMVVIGLLGGLFYVATVPSRRIQSSLQDAV